MGRRRTLEWYRRKIRPLEIEKRKIEKELDALNAVIQLFQDRTLEASNDIHGTEA